MTPEIVLLGIIMWLWLSAVAVFLVDLVRIARAGR